MIGKKIKSYRHLFREVDGSLNDVLIYYNNGGSDNFCEFCKAIKGKLVGKDEEMLFIFNNSFHFGSCRFTDALRCDTLTPEDVGTISRSFSGTSSICSSGETALTKVTDGIVLLPKTFEDDYNKFLTSNAKMFRTFMSKYGLDVNDRFCKTIYLYTEGSKNFFLWAVNTYFQNGTSLDTIKRIMNWHKTYGRLSSKLSKNTITAYTSRNLDSLFEEMYKLRNGKRVNDVINSFNTAQKKLFKGAELSDKDIAIISRFYRLSDAKKENFIRKVSTITDFDELMHQMKHITNAHFDWNKESFMDFLHNVEGMDYDIVFEKGDVVLLKVNNYETVKYLAKTTSWCISKNRLYWKQYVANPFEFSQYVLFDFSKKEDDLLSIIGFTSRFNVGLVNAHDFMNNNILTADERKVLLHSFVSTYNQNKSIFSVLKNAGIDLYKLVSYEKPLFEWNKESMYEYLFSCVNKDNVTVLCDKGDLVAVSVADENIRYFLGDAYMDSIDSYQWSYQHIIFMDFSMDKANPNRILTAIINNDDGSLINNEAYCTIMFNEHMTILNDATDGFEVKRAEFGLPFDVIRRQGGIYAEIATAFETFNLPLINEMAKDNETLIKAISSMDTDMVESIMNTSINVEISFDYLDLFYNRGLRLHDVFSKDAIVNLIDRGLSTLLFSYEDVRNPRLVRVPNEEEIDRFYSGNLDTLERAREIGRYLAIMKILDAEGNDDTMQDVYNELIRIVYANGYKGEVTDEIMLKIGKNLDFENSEGNYWTQFALVNGGEKVKAFAMELMASGTIPELSMLHSTDATLTTSKWSSEGEWVSISLD